MNIPKGKIIILTAEDYSDYYIRAVLRAKKDITDKIMNDIEKSVRENVAFVRRSGEDRIASLQKYFVARLITAEYFEELDCEELHLGSYGELELDLR